MNQPFRKDGTILPRFFVYSRMQAQQQTIEIAVEDIAEQGVGVGRIDGLVYFVEGAIPGDRVSARVVKRKKQFVVARTIAIIEPSSDRRNPRCRHFGTCGGCKWQYLQYDAQLRFKQSGVAEALRRIGEIPEPPIHPILGCDSPYYYRNKMEFTFSGERWLTDEDMASGVAESRQLALGLHVPQRYDKVVDLQECYLQSETSTSLLHTVRAVCRRLGQNAYSTRSHTGYLRHLVIREGKRTGEIMVNLVTTNDQPETMRAIVEEILSAFPHVTTIVNNITDRKSMVAVGDMEVVYHGPGYITERIGKSIFRISANSFFQTNTIQTERLYDVVRDCAGLSNNDIVYDLYSGTGTIAIHLSHHAEMVIGIELVDSAIRDAEENAALNDVTNCRFLRGDLKERLTVDSQWQQSIPSPHVVVTDPPRSGMHPKVVAGIIDLAPDRIVYVSCNPATQARDVKLLVEGGYEVREVYPVDMFPHTSHVEAVALLVKRR